MKPYVFSLLMGCLLLNGMVGCAPTTQRVTPRTLEKEADTLHEAYMQCAQHHRDNGNHRDAFVAYQLALTVKPDASEAQAQLLRTEDTMKAQAFAYHQMGMRLYRMGKFLAARHKFLTALRLNPQLDDARDMLTRHHRILSAKHVVHEIEPGDTLTRLSQKYYGDARYYPFIAEYNQITDATQISVGQSINVPRLRDLPFYAARDRYSHSPAVAENGSTGPEEVVDQAAIYWDQGLGLYNQHQFAEAAYEFAKVLETRPDDQSARSHLSDCYFKQGDSLYKKQQFMAAKQMFQSAISYDPHCKECENQITKCEIGFKEKHYQAGMTRFEQEQPQEAIIEWRKVMSVDPGYKQVSSLIRRAQIILKNLKALRQMQEKLDP